MKVRPWSVRPDFRLTAHVVAGRYRLDDLLGRGGGADVYEGLDLRLRRPVAVKVLRPEGEAVTEERFDSEARLLARLQHPGLVTVYDCGREDGQPYLIMQLIRGTTLRTRIAREPLTPAEACRIGSALASALAHVHANGVVHRDVKPSNILLDEAGTPHLTDFGISRLLDSTARTATGALVGTAAYMAPEQVLGRGAGPASDIYSLGLVLLESLKAELEYDGAPLEAAIARLHRPPVIPPELPAELAELLRAMTASDEAGRPDARACCRALTAAAADSGSAPWAGPLRPREGEQGAEPVATSTTREGTSVPRSAFRAPAGRRAHRALLAAGSTLAVLGLALTGSTGGLPTDDRDAAARTPRPATTEPATTDPAAPAGDHSGRPTPSPTTPTSPAGTAEAAAGADAVTDDPGTPAAPATSREKSGDPRAENVRGPAHDRTRPQPGQVKPPAERDEKAEKEKERAEKAEERAEERTEADTH
ncbi:serine/threonine-protein kinase [Streptomyces gobitricini]|uniref:non-specific serine/threonine protein kinase n=1 Tax=Streptomyces gobitricini TaxID=68211 RepID=A0ABN3MZ79_9ACTN